MLKPVNVHACCCCTVQDVSLASVVEMQSRANFSPPNAATPLHSLLDPGANSSLLYSIVPGKPLAAGKICGTEDMALYEFPILCSIGGMNHQCFLHAARVPAGNRSSSPPPPVSPGPCYVLSCTYPRKRAHPHGGAAVQPPDSQLILPYCLGGLAASEGLGLGGLRR